MNSVCILALATCILVANGVHAQDSLFAPAVNYGVGSRPFSVFSADLDDDGDLDLAVANLGSDNVSVLMNLTDPPTDSGLVGYWSFDEGSGDTTYDASGFANNGVVNNAAWVEGRSRSALSFDGQTAYVQIPNASQYNMTQELSVEAWILMTPWQSFSQPSIFDKSHSGPPNLGGYTLQGAQGGNQAINFVACGNSGCQEVSSGTALYDSTWHFITGTVSTQDGLIRFYLDGQPTAASPFYGSVNANDGDVFIGRWFMNDRYFSGIIDEVKVYDRALTPEEVWLHYAAFGADSVPNTLIVGGPDADQHLDTAIITFAWTGTDDATPVESLLYSHKMDDSNWTTFTSDTSYTFVLGEGYHTFMVRAMDGDMNVDSTPATRNFAVDLTPPNTELVSGPTDSAWIETPFVTFYWTGTDNLSVVEDLEYAYKIDSDTLSDFGNDTSHTFSGLTDGLHTFSCMARDKAGNEDPTPVLAEFWVKFVDLLPTAIMITDSAYCNTLVEISWNVVNTGDGLVAGTWKDRIYLSDDSAFGSDTYLGEVVISDSLYFEDSYTVLDTFLLPDSLEGDFWIIVKIDTENDVHEEGNEANNTLIADHSTVLSIPPHPDLQVINIEVPTDGWTGQAIDVQWTVANLGDTAILSPWTEYVYLSADSIIGSDALVTTFTYTEGLDSGSSYTHIHPVPIPEDAPGEYWVVVTTDGPNEVGEYEFEDNNLRISDSSVTAYQSPFPDLQVPLVEGPDSAISGQSIDVSWTVTNNGTGATDAPVWYDYVYLSVDTILGGDLVLGSFQNFSYLASGQSYQQTQAVTLPWELAGPHYVLVMTDAAGHVDEHSAEGNNVGSSNTMWMEFAQEPTPHLVASIIYLPTTAWAGADVTVTWEVTNIGDAPAVSTYHLGFDDALWLSSDEFLDVGDYMFGSHWFHPSPLNPGSSDTITAVVTLPDSVSGSLYVIVIPDTHDFTGSAITLGVDSLLVSPKPPADLEVTSVVIAMDTVPSGSLLDVTWTVTNNGLEETMQTTWTDGLYLSLDDSLDIGVDQLVSTRTFSGNLLRDSSYTQIDSIVIPNEMSGTYYLIVFTDLNNNVDEDMGGSGEDNNWSASIPFEILFTPPDLQVTDIIPPDSAFSGQTTQVEWVVTNLGPGRTAATAWHDKVYLSEDDSLEVSDDLLLYDYSRSGALDSGSYYESTTEIRIPHGFSGQYYLFVVTDAEDSVFEDTLEGNNVGYSAFTVILTPPPDLQVSEFLGPDSAFSGQTISVQWTVANNGEGGTSVTSWKDHVYLSMDNTPNTDQDMLLYTLTHNDSLAAGGSYLENRDILIPPDSAGSFYLKLLTDAEDNVYEHQNEGNNVSVLPIEVRVPGPDDLQLPDLVVSDFQIPSPVTAGDTLTINWTVTNTGDYPTPASVSYWIDAVYFSEDTILEASSDTVIAQFSYLQILEPDSSYIRIETITCPDGVEGQYYLFMVTDFNNRVSEVQEANNGLADSSMIELLPPDLYVVSIAAPDSADCGQPVAISWTVINQGIGATNVSQWYDGVYLSKDQILDETDFNVGYFQHTGSLEPDSSYVVSLAPEIPPGLSGPYYVIVKTDKNDNVYEYDSEGNNYTRSQTVSEIILPQPVNLAVTNITAPDSAIAGEDVTISWTVANLSENDITGQWTDAVYLSPDTVWDYYDPVIGTAQLTGGLRAGKSYSRSISVSIEDFFGDLDENTPGVTVGEYRAIVRTDIRNNINETDEDDNASVDPDNLSVNVRELTLDVPYLDSLSTGDQRYYRIEVPEGEDLRITLDCNDDNAVTELYVRYGDVPDRIHYDFSSDGPDAHSEVTVSSTQAGTYYILLVESFSVETSFSLSTTLLEFAVEEVSPARGGNTGHVTATITGARFVDGATVCLKNTDSCDIEAEEVLWVLSTVLKARFNLKDTPEGIMHLQVTNPGGQSVTAYSSFTVESGADPQVGVYFTGHSVVRQGENATVQIQLSNLSNIDIPFTMVLVAFADTAGTLLPLNLGPETQWDDLQYDLETFVFEDTRVFPLLLFDLPPETKLTIPFRVDALNSLSLRVVAQPVSLEEVQQGLTAAFHGLTELMLETDVLDSTLVEAFEFAMTLSPEELFDFSIRKGSNDSRWLNPEPHVEMLISLAIYKIGTIIPVPAGDVLSISRAAQTLASPDTKLQWQKAKALMTIVTASVGVFAFVMLEPTGLLKVAAILYVGGQLVNLIDFLWSLNEPEPRVGLLLENIDTSNDAIPGLFVWDVRVVAPRDPNEKIGPTGADDDNSIPMDVVLPYTVYFENMPDASAPAVDVTVTDQLDTLLDWRKFRLGEIAFGDTTIIVPDNRSYWHTTVDLDSLGLLLEIDAGINAFTGEAHWYFNTIDPSTGQPPVDPFAGFLPPNDSTGRGEGHVAFTIEADDDLPEGTEITNSATIVFDINDPIETNEVVNVIYHPQPDLLVMSAGVSSDSATLWSGLPATVEAVVENGGDGDAEEFSIKLFLESPADSNWVLLASTQTTGLVSGGTIDAMFNWTPSHAVYSGQLHVIADYENAITEADEANNTRSISIYVGTFVADIDGDGFGPDVSDLVYLVDYMFRGGPAPPLMEAADVNCSGGDPDIADLVYLINYIFRQGPPPCDPGRPETAPKLFASNHAGRCELKARPLADNHYCLEVWGDFECEVAGFQQEYRYDPELITVDSVVAGSENREVDLFVSSSGGQIKLGMVDVEGKRGIRAGRSKVLDIYFHTKVDVQLDPSSFSHTFTKAVDRKALLIPLDISTSRLWLALPKSFALHQNYPNPFNPSTTIEYALPKSAHVEIKIFNLLGQKVTTLVNQPQVAGHHAVIWSGMTSQGKPAATGVYFYRIEAGEFVDSKKMLLLK